MENDQQSCTVSPHKSFKLIQPAWSTVYTYIPASAPNHKTATPLFVVGISSFKPHKPHLILHSGPDRKTSPAVACSWIIATSRSSKVGLGDVVNAPDRIVWEDFKQETLRGSEFSWGLDLEGERKYLRWKRTSHHAVDGKKANRWSSRNWKLVSRDDNSEIICVFTSEGGLTTVCGTLQFNVEWGTDFEYMVLITVAYL